MRKFLISLLLAGAAATPAIAAPHDWSDRAQAREDRQSAREQRQEVREQRQEARSAERSERQADVRQQYVERRQFNGGNRYDGERNGYDGQRNGYDAQRNAYAAQRNAYAAQRDAYAAQRNYGEQRQRDGRDWRQSDRRMPGVMHDRNALEVNRYARQRGDWAGRQQAMRWNRDWRHDRHYDWRNYRNHHRSRFHLGLYIDPFGWGYNPFSIGYRIRPNYYGNQYWIDAGMYGLPYPPPGAVWVRYWNDAVLVDTYTGTVIDVIPSFFW